MFPYDKSNSICVFGVRLRIWWLKIDKKNSLVNIHNYHYCLQIRQLNGPKDKTANHNDVLHFILNHTKHLLSIVNMMMIAVVKAYFYNSYITYFWGFKLNISIRYLLNWMHWNNIHFTYVVVFNWRYFWGNFLCFAFEYLC